MVHSRRSSLCAHAFAGDIQYGGGFMHLYTLLGALTGGSLLGFQAVWAAIELAVIVLLRRLLARMHVPGWIALLLFSNRLHLYNVRVVINDLPAVAAALVAVYAILEGRHTLASISMSFGISNKLNIVFYGPAMVLVYFVELGFWRTAAQGLVILGVQVCVVRYRASSML